MRVTLPLLLSAALVAAAAPLPTPDSGNDSGPRGDYVVVAVREASGVAHTAPPPGLPDLVGRSVRIDAPGRWIDGQPCRHGRIRPAAAPWPHAADPNLSDLQLDAAPDLRLDRALVLDCGGRARSALVPLLQVDARVMVAVIDNSVRFAVLEKPLPRDAARQVERALAKAGFDPGPADGVVDAGTRRAVGAYARAAGAAYAFAPGVLSANLVVRLTANRAGGP